MIKRIQLPPIILAAAIQCAPLSRLPTLTPAEPPVGYAVLSRCLLGAAVALGGYDAVSAASASIVGLAPVNPPDAVTTRAAGQVGQNFDFQIVVINSGVNPGQNFWDATPLPPGLTINTNVGANGQIFGVPTKAGTFIVNLIAGNVNYGATTVHKQVLIAISAATDTAPHITTQPVDKIVPVGSNVTFSVTADGTNLSYVWLFDKTVLPNATTATLTLSNVITNQSGAYSVIISNSVGTATSANAQLLVLPPPGTTTAPSLSSLSLINSNLTFSFNATGYRYSLQSSDTLSAGSWTELTNVPPSVVPFTVQWQQAIQAAPHRFYRVQVSAQ